MLGGGKLVELELVPVFEEMIQDVEIVQMGVIKYLAEFLKMLSEPCRVSYLPLLHDILHSTNPFNWRLRQSLSSQLSELLSLPPTQSVYMTLFPLVMTLLQDPVACVRRDCFRGVAKMLILLRAQADDCPQGEVHFAAVVRAVNSLARGEAYNTRQLWAELAYVLLQDLDQALFEKHFIDGLLVLATDPVFNVRLAVGVVLGGWAPQLAPWESASSPWKYLTDRADIKECVRRLACDDKDVISHVSKLKPAYPDIVFSAITCRGRRGAPGGSDPIVNCQTGKRAGDALPSLGTADEEDSAHDSIDLSIAATLSVPSPNKHGGIIKLSSPSSSSSSSALEGSEGFGGCNRTAAGSPPLDESPLLAALQGETLPADDEKNIVDPFADNVLPGPDSPIPTGVVPLATDTRDLVSELAREVGIVNIDS